MKTAASSHSRYNDPSCLHNIQDFLISNIRTCWMDLPTEEAEV